MSPSNNLRSPSNRQHWIVHCWFHDWPHDPLFCWRVQAVLCVGPSHWSCLPTSHFICIWDRKPERNQRQGEDRRLRFCINLINLPELCTLWWIYRIAVTSTNSTWRTDSLLAPPCHATHLDWFSVVFVGFKCAPSSLGLCLATRLCTVTNTQWKLRVQCCNNAARKTGSSLHSPY